MFLKRLLSGIVLILVLLALIIPGKAVTVTGFALISFVALYELYKAFGLTEKIVLCVLGFVASGIIFLVLMFGMEGYIYLVFAGLILILFMVYVLSYPKISSGEIAHTLFGVLYAPLLLSFIPLVRGMEGGLFYSWLIFISSWGCDTMAYCVGRLFGKHRLSPTLSPKKSIEGAVGGVVGAGLLGFIYAEVVVSFFGFDRNVLYIFPAICAIASVFSQAGDLFASGIKREKGIKDYGNLIPGHGGIMDRFDSVMVTAPLVYAIAMCLK